MMYKLNFKRKEGIKKAPEKEALLVVIGAF